MDNILAFFSILLLPIYFTPSSGITNMSLKLNFTKKKNYAVDPVLMLNIILDSHTITSITMCICNFGGFLPRMVAYSSLF